MRAVVTSKTSTIKSHIVIIAVIISCNAVVTNDIKWTCSILWKKDNEIPESCFYESTIPGLMQFKAVKAEDGDVLDADPNWTRIRATILFTDITVTKDIIKMEFPEGSHMRGSTLFRENDTGLEEKAMLRTDQQTKLEYLRPDFTWFIKPSDEDVKKIIEEQNKELKEEEEKLDGKLPELTESLEQAKEALELMRKLKRRVEERTRQKEKITVLRKRNVELELIRMGCTNTLAIQKTREAEVKGIEEEMRMIKKKMKQKEKDVKRKEEEDEEKKKQIREQRDEERRKQLEERRKARKQKKVKKMVKPTHQNATTQNMLQKSLTKSLRLEFGSKTLFYIWYHGLLDKELKTKSGVVYKIHEWIANLFRWLVGLERVGLDDYKLPYAAY